MAALGHFKGIFKDYVGVYGGLYWDNGKENGNYCLGFIVLLT